MESTLLTRESPLAEPQAHAPHHRHHDEATVRAVGIVGFVAVALIHVLDLQSKFAETPYLGVAYLALIAGLLVAAFDLVRGETRRGWTLGGSLAAATFAGYAVNRIWGMPGAMDDVGNWLEPLGLASLFVEGSIAVLAAWVFTRPGSPRANRSPATR